MPRSTIQKPAVRRGIVALTVSVMTTATAVLTACAPSLTGTSDHVNYRVNELLITSNSASMVGATTDAEVLTARVYPGVFVEGPSGQMIPNTEIATATEIPGDPLQVSYSIAANAKYSNDTALTCTDFQLAYVAAVMTDIFHSHQPLMQQIFRFDCDFGSKQFTITFHEGQGDRWRYLFGPGSVLPAQTIAKKIGMDPMALQAALDDMDEEALAPVAEVWNTGFNLTSFEPELQASYGPYRIEWVGQSGEVTLVANESYNGDQPIIQKIVVWPDTADIAQVAQTKHLGVGEFISPDSVEESGFAPEDYEVETVAGIRTESLRLVPTGILAQPENRQALAACVDRDVMARISSEFVGIEVSPVRVHTVHHNDPMVETLRDQANELSKLDLKKARRLTGKTIRVGYMGPDARKAAMVQALAQSCKRAGITIEDASAETSSLEDWGRIKSDGKGSQEAHEGTVDVYFGAINPMQQYGASSPSLTSARELLDTEKRMWEELPFIPVAVEPRTFVHDPAIGNVVLYTDSTGIGWNMDRWQF